MSDVFYAVEGPTDEPVAEKLIIAAGCVPRRIYTAGGKTKLDQKIPGYNRGGAHRPWLVLRDLDSDDLNTCIPEVLERLAGGPLSMRFALRLPVRAVEAWLIADRVAFSDYFSVAESRISMAPDQIDNPKQHLVNLCRKSRSKSMRHAMVPRPEALTRVGPEYVATVRKFVAEHWDPHRGSTFSPSLTRALARVGALASSGAWDLK